MSLTKGQIRKLKGKLSRVNPDSEKAKRIRATLGIEEPTQVVETTPAPKPVLAPEPEPEPVETASPAIEIVETVVVEPVPAAKPKRTYRRRKTKTTTKE